MGSRKDQGVIGIRYWVLGIGYGFKVKGGRLKGKGKKVIGY